MPEGNQADSLIQFVINNPLFWLVALAIVGYFFYKEHNRTKMRPEESPDFGVKFRAARVKEHLDKRAKDFAIKPDIKITLWRDIWPIGIINSIERIPQKERIDKVGAKGILTAIETGKQSFLNIINYRRAGFFNWLKALFGFGLSRLLVDEDSITREGIKGGVKYVLGDDLYFRERGGVMFLSRETDKKFIDEINADRDYENAKGFVSDFPRRLANLSPSHASAADILELQAKLEKDKKESMKSSWAGGGK